MALTDVEKFADEARRLRCTHYLAKGVPVALDEKGEGT